jgi:hypothetical protein
MIEPQLPEAGPAATVGVVSLHLLETQSRAHIGHRLLHQETGGELVEDPVWRWSSAPDRYLESALRLAAASAGVQLVDTSSAPTAAVTLITWNLESAGGSRLVGAVELNVLAADRAVHTEVIRASESVSSELPGDLASAAGRLLAKLAVESLQRAALALKSVPRHEIPA